jgi:hypothetical protein
MKTLLGLALLAGFFWILKVISDGLVDRVPKSWYTSLPNAKPKKDEDDSYDPVTDPAYEGFSCLNMWNDGTGKDD